MKEIIFSILIFSALSCNTEIVEPLVYSREGKVILFGDPNNHGCGWTLETNQGEIFVPNNLSNEFKVDSLVIGMTLEPTEEEFLCNFNLNVPIVRILNIEKL